MSSPKKTAFLTETSNIDEPLHNKSFVSNQTGQTDDYYDNEKSPYNDEGANDESDEDDEEFDDDKYPNPFVEAQADDKVSRTYSHKKKSAHVENENEDPISAIPPKVQQQDEAVVEMSSTPAFQCLEEVSHLHFIALYFLYISNSWNQLSKKLFQKGKLTGTQVAQLKAKYIELHLTLKK